MVQINQYVQLCVSYELFDIGIYGTFVWTESGNLSPKLGYSEPRWRLNIEYFSIYYIFHIYMKKNTESISQKYSLKIQTTTSQKYTQFYLKF